jgi:hypothetical protein
VRLATQLEPIARRIECLETTAILQIANEAAKIHECFRYRRDEGGYTGFMQKRLGYSSSSAYRLLDVHTRFGTNVSQVWETLPVSAVYLLAAPSTPQEAVDSIGKRVEAGEKLSYAAVTKVIAQAKAAAKDDQSNSASDDEEQSITERREQHAALFAESSDSVALAGAANESLGAPGVARNQSPKESKERRCFDNTLFLIREACTNNDEMVIPELTAQERSEAVDTLAECMSALQVLFEKIGGSASPKPRP